MKYILKVSVGLMETEEELTHWTKEDFEAFENRTLPEDEFEHIRSIACDLVDFEYWIEEVEDDNEE